MKLVEELGNRDDDDEKGTKLKREGCIGGGEGRRRFEAAALPLVILRVAPEKLVRPQRPAQLLWRSHASKRVARRPVRLSPIHLEIVGAVCATRHQVRGPGKYVHDHDRYAEDEVSQDDQAEAREGNCDRRTVARAVREVVVYAPAKCQTTSHRSLCSRAVLESPVDALHMNATIWAMHRPIGHQTARQQPPQNWQKLHTQLVQQ